MSGPLPELKEAMALKAIRAPLPPDRYHPSGKNQTLIERLQAEFQLSDGDVQLTGSGNDKWRALEGTLTAAETL